MWTQQLLRWTSDAETSHLLGSSLSLVMALVSCVVQGLHMMQEDLRTILNILDYAITAYFAFEMAVKLNAQGHSFFKRGWNKFDIYILFVEMADYILDAYNLSFKSHHIVTPMRLISRERKLRSLVSVLLAIRSLLGYVLLVLFFIIYIFAMAGVQLWRTMPSFNMGATSFKNIGFAWITIFQVVTLEGWTAIMHFVADTRGFMWFIVFIFIAVIGHIIIINVCTVVIATQFTEAMEVFERKEAAGLVSVKMLVLYLCNFLVRLVTRCISFICFCKKDSHVQNKMTSTSGMIWNSIQKRLKMIVHHKIFSLSINVAVFLNCLVMAADYHGQDKTVTRVIFMSNLIFTIIFVIEMVIKLMALSLGYFKDKDNVVDFAIVIVSLLRFTFDTSVNLSAVRAFRLLRFRRLIDLFPAVKQQLLVLRSSMDKASTLCCLMLFVIFVFSILGMHLFRDRFIITSPSGDLITIRKNFDSLPTAMITVFQVLTLEDWDEVLYNAMAYASPWAAVYFIILIVFGAHMLLNLLVGIVVENFHSLAPPKKLSRKNTQLPAFHEKEKEHTHVKRNPIQRVLHWCKRYEDWSLYVLSPQNKFRRCLLNMINRKRFDQVSLFFIVLTALTIAMERPSIENDSAERKFLDISSLVFTGVFLVEMLIKVGALGLIFGKNSYCKSTWNVIDGFLVVLSLIHIGVKVTAESAPNMINVIRVLRLLRTFRPLRLIKRFPKLKLVVETLVNSLRPLVNITVISILFFIMYGVLGVQMFKGTFYYCEGADTSSITNKTDCLLAGYIWTRKSYNFDNLLEAMQTVFVMYSKDGWMRIMYDGVDAVGIDQQPIKNYSPWMVLYFLSFMVLSIFLLDLFIGVMVEAFHHTQQKQLMLLDAAGELSAREGADEEDEGLGINQQATKPTLIRVVDIFLKVLVIFYTVVLSVAHHNQPQYLDDLSNYTLHVAAGILIFEVITKITLLGFMKFGHNGWNKFDIFWLLVYTIFHITRVPITSNILGICLVVRVAEVLKSKKFIVLLTTITETLAQLGSISLLFFFFYFIYAALGVELFGKLECTPDYQCVTLSHYTNFQNFGMAVLTLFQVTTGDEWSGILSDTIRECTPGQDGCTPYLRWVSPIYFTTFVVIAQFALMNLVVAAILQALKESKKKLKERDELLRAAGTAPVESADTAHVQPAGPSAPPHWV